MKKMGWMVILLVLSNSAMAAGVDFSTCDSMYAQRGAEALKAADCYEAKIGVLSSEDQQAAFDRIFITLSAVINGMPKTSEERSAINRGLSAVDHYLKNFSSDARYYYWKACFVSFDVIEKDRGKIIPSHMFGVLGDLQAWLQKANQLDPGTHFYGPARVLGMMHTQMPKIAGGDKIYAEKLLREAYVKAPKFSMNHLAYARILDANGKTTQAIDVLNKYLSINNAEFDPDPSNPLTSVVPETIREKREAQQLLDEISE